LVILRSGSPFAPTLAGRRGGKRGENHFKTTRRKRISFRPARNRRPQAALSGRAAAPKQMETGMDWNRVEGNWKQVKGKIKEKWGNLTDDDLDKINGRRDQLEGRIQERYGLARDRVRRDVEDWLKMQP
jgi:uncharacterized protein YjbJ (UPF0337 family)